MKIIDSTPGYIDIGGRTIERADLAECLPDIERFERCLEMAKRADAYMREHDGAVPPFMRALEQPQLSDVSATMGELASLRRAAADLDGDGPEASA